MTSLRPVFAFVLGSAALMSCGKDAGTTPVDPGPDAGNIVDPPAYGFQVKSPDITIQPNEEVTYCYYFKTPNTETMAIKKWASHMALGSHHMIMYTTTGETPGHPPGSAPSTGDCGAGTGTASSIPVWTYATQTEDQELAMPTDDGAGKPVGMEIAAGQNAYFQMHYLNSGDVPRVVNVTLNAEAYPKEIQTAHAYTKTAAYVTYNGDISIPPHAVGFEVHQTCATPAGAKFWTLSTHSHKQSKHTAVYDGAGLAGTMKFSDDNWEHPASATWNPSFDGFGSNKLTFSCTYDNTVPASEGGNADKTITDGNSAVDNEMCMAVGYFFPATGPKICYSGFVVQ